MRIPAGARHDPRAHAIRLLLVIAAELQERAAGDVPRRDVRGGRAAGVAQQRPQQAQAKVRHHRVRQLLRRVPLRDVCDLVREDAGQLRLGARRLHRAAIQPHGAARQRERVDLAVVSHRKAVRVALPFRVRSELAPDPRNVRLHRRIAHLRRLLLHFRLRLFADRDLVGNRDELDRAGGDG